VKTILVTGSREYGDRRAVWGALNDRLIQHGAFVLKHGACPSGADMHARTWFILVGSHAGVTEDPYPADWPTHGKAAGFIRNKEMIDSGADEVLAFFQAGATNKGTQNTVDLAHKAGILIFSWGSFTG